MWIIRNVSCWVAERSFERAAKEVTSDVNLKLVSKDTIASIHECCRDSEGWKEKSSETKPQSAQKKGRAELERERTVFRWLRPETRLRERCTGGEITGNLQRVSVLDVASVVEISEMECKQRMREWIIVSAL